MAEHLPAPVGLRTRAQRFWRDVTCTFDLERDEVELLREIVRTMNECDLLDEVVRTEGVMVRGSRNNSVVNPAIASLNSHRSTLGKLLAQLALPDENGEPVVDSPRTARARVAANERWRLEREKRGKRDTPFRAQRHTQAGG